MLRSAQTFAIPSTLYRSCKTKTPALPIPLLLRCWQSSKSKSGPSFQQTNAQLEEAAALVRDYTAGRNRKGNRAAQNIYHDIAWPKADTRALIPSESHTQHIHMGGTSQTIMSSSYQFKHLLCFLPFLPEDLQKQLSKQVETVHYAKTEEAASLPDDIWSKTDCIFASSSKLPECLSSLDKCPNLRFIQGE